MPTTPTAPEAKAAPDSSPAASTPLPPLTPLPSRLPAPAQLPPKPFLKRLINRFKPQVPHGKIVVDGLDYTLLQHQLAKDQWPEADQLTHALMGLAIGKTRHHSFQRHAFCNQVRWPVHRTTHHSYLTSSLSAALGPFPSRRWVAGNHWWSHMEWLQERWISCSST